MTGLPPRLRENVLSIVGCVSIPFATSPPFVAVAGTKPAPLSDVQPLSGGFSGAAVFRVTSPQGQPVVVKRWPPGTDATRLAALHSITDDLIDASFDCLARPCRRTSDGSSILQVGGPRRDETIWHVEVCRLGRADFWTAPSTDRARSVGRLMGRLHQQLTRITNDHPSFRIDGRQAPRVFAERLSRTHQLQLPNFTTLVKSSSRLQSLPGLERALPLIQRSLPGIAEELATLLAQCPINATQICLRDLWHESVFWTNDEITGLIDLAAARADHPVGDLSRLFGSLFRGDQTLWDEALDAYQSVRPLSPFDHRLLRCLTRSEVAITTASWVEWFANAHHDTSSEQRKQAQSRLTHYIERCQIELP